MKVQRQHRWWPPQILDRLGLLSSSISLHLFDTEKIHRNSVSSLYDPSKNSLIWEKVNHFQLKRCLSCNRKFAARSFLSSFMVCSKNWLFSSSKRNTECLKHSNCFNFRWQLRSGFRKLILEFFSFSQRSDWGSRGAIPSQIPMNLSNFFQILGTDRKQNTAVYVL